MTTSGILTIIAGLAAAGAAGTGFRGAQLWLRASTVQPHPGWTFERPELVIPELPQMDWAVAILNAGQDSGAPNAWATRWTAAAVVLAAAQSAAGYLASVFA